MFEPATFRSKGFETISGLSMSGISKWIKIRQKAKFIVFQVVMAGFGSWRIEKRTGWAISSFISSRHQEDLHAL